MGTTTTESELMHSTTGAPRARMLAVCGTPAAVDDRVAELLASGWTLSGQTISHKRGVKEVRLVRAVELRGEVER
jgi:hypothetical protein